MSVDDWAPPDPSVWRHDERPRPAPSRCEHEWQRHVVAGDVDHYCGLCGSWRSALTRPAVDLDGDSNLESTGNREGRWVVWDDYGWGGPIQDER